MKKILLGILIGGILFIPATAIAGIGYTNTIRNIGGDDDTVSVFDDGDNKCYVAKGRATESRAFPGHTVAISCVKETR